MIRNTALSKMSLSVEKLFHIIEIVKLESRAGSSDDNIYTALRNAELLPAKFVKDHIDGKIVKTEVESIFASKQAEEQASKLKLVLQPGGGSAKNNRYSLADINKIAKSTKTQELDISPQARIKASELGIPITALENAMGSGINGRILLSDIEAHSTKKKEEVKITSRAKELAEEAQVKIDTLSSITGSGHNGKITLEDVKKVISDSSDSDSSKKNRKKKTDSSDSSESSESDDQTGKQGPSSKNRKK